MKMTYSKQPSFIQRLIEERYTFSKGYFTVKKQIGAIHQREKQPCQDACGSFKSSDGSTVILAIADGHGDKRHDFSHIGADLAVENAISIMKAASKDFSNPVALEHFIKYDFPRLIVRKWRNSVRLDARRRLGKSYFTEKKQIYVRYGTTLMLTAVINDSVYFAQLGDGMMVLINSDGDVEIPFYEDDGLRGNETFSLASRNASKRWRITQWEAPNADSLLLICTDGLVNCFQDDSDFLHFSASLYFTVKVHSFSKVIRSLPVWFSEYTAQGSGDDIAAGLIFFKK